MNLILKFGGGKKNRCDPLSDQITKYVGRIHSMPGPGSTLRVDRGRTGRLMAQSFPHPRWPLLPKPSQCLPGARADGSQSLPWSPTQFCLEESFRCRTVGSQTPNPKSRSGVTLWTQPWQETVAQETLSASNVGARAKLRQPPLQLLSDEGGWGSGLSQGLKARTAEQPELILLRTLNTQLLTAQITPPFAKHLTQQNTFHPSPYTVQCAFSFLVLYNWGNWASQEWVLEGQARTLAPLPSHDLSCAHSCPCTSSLLADDPLAHTLYGLPQLLNYSGELTLSSPFGKTKAQTRENAASGPGTNGKQNPQPPAFQASALLLLSGLLPWALNSAELQRSKWAGNRDVCPKQSPPKNRHSSDRGIFANRQEDANMLCP